MNRQGGRGGGRSDNRNRTRTSTRDDIERTNPRFEAYYNSLRLVPDEERARFWDVLRQDLPNSFRFTGSKSRALSVQQSLRDRYIPEIVSIKHEGEQVAPPIPIQWFPDHLAWQMTTPKNVVRRFPPFAAFQKFLVSETSVGNISRQEVVSMIPPLLMDLRPGMTILDMCAAPGSKAAQLIELLHAGEEARMRTFLRKHRKDIGRSLSPDGTEIQKEMDGEDLNEGLGDWSDDGRATGLLIANDSDYKRAHMLTHQMKRFNSPNLIVTNHDATMFPSIKLPSRSVPNSYLKFDRILADVPCSGDGTCRKNLNVWKDWSAANALGLFSQQQRLLVRALQMLKVGGRVVYSTCSMNPVENEAVVASAIERCGGPSNVEIVDCKDVLPDLVRTNGLSNWSIMDKYGQTWQKWEDVEEYRRVHGEDKTGKLVSAMFPPLERTGPLDRCMRIYPHMQNTGAFFIAVLEKRSGIKAKPESEPVKAEQQKSTLVDAVNQIEKQPLATDSNPTAKLDALDAIAPPSTTNGTGNPSAAARQNQDVASGKPTSPKKRALDAEADAAMSTKRPKFREEVDEPASEGAEDRRVHWPPPPGAALDVSRPETVVDLPQPVEQADRSNQAQPGKGSSIRQTDARASMKPKTPYEEPFKYLSPDEPNLKSIYSFYDLSSHFPRDRFMVRNAMGEPAKTIYYTSELARDILIENANSGIKFVHAGVKMFVRQDVMNAEVCKWRIQSEGLPLLESWVSEQRSVKLYKRATLHGLLVEMFPKIEGDGWTKLGEIAERMRDISMGCCILRVEPSDAGDGFKERMTLPLWRSLQSLNLMLPKDERSAMLLRLYGEDTPLQDHSKNFQRKKDRNAAVVKDEDTNDTKEDVKIKDADEAIEEVKETKGFDDAKVEMDAEEGAVSTAVAHTEDMMDSDSDGGVPLPDET